MGFAVVADEVRSLAQRSARSARETAEKIEEAIRKSDHGVGISTKVAASLSEIVDKARQVDGLIAEISTASKEQSQGISQVNTAVGQMDQVTQANAGNAEETAAAAEELSAQAKSMQESVAELRRLVNGKSANESPSVSRGSRDRKPAAAPMAMRRPALTTPSTDSELSFVDMPSSSSKASPRLVRPAVSRSTGGS